MDLDGTYRLCPAGGLSTDRKWLSCSADGTVVNLWHEVDPSGRQWWTFARRFDPTEYSISVGGGTPADRRHLSCNADGSTVDLWTRGGDTSGRQIWDVYPMHDNGSIYLIRNRAVSVGQRKFLSCNADGTVVDLWYENDGSGRQQWLLI